MMALFPDRPQPYAITIAFNRNKITEQYARQTLTSLLKGADKRRLGGRFYEKPIDERTMVYLVPEHEASNLHYHGYIWLAPDDVEKFGFEAVHAQYQKDFNDLVENGSILIKPIDDPAGWLTYISKVNHALDCDPGKIVYGPDTVSPKATRH